MSNNELSRLYLFSPSIWKTTIPPGLYNKQELFNIIQENYEISPLRNEWDSKNKDNWHHSYNDETNPKFKKLDLAQLNSQYDLIIKSFMDNLSVVCPIKYHYRIVNVTANKHVQKMRQHNHLGTVDDTDNWYSFSCVHYLSLKEGHTCTRLMNPSSFVQYYKTYSHVSDIFNLDDPNNTEYSESVVLDCKEDDFIIMPSYINHLVDPSDKNTEDLRVTIVINIWIEKVKGLKNEQN